MTELSFEKKADSSEVDPQQAEAPKTVLTGDRPSGCLHLGHYVGSLLNRVSLQNRYKQYILVADLQALTDHWDYSEVQSRKGRQRSFLKENIFELVRDYLAVGIDPQKTTVVIQSQLPALCELTMYFMNLVNLGRLERNPTVKAEIQQKNYGDNVTAGFLCYPISQAADIAGFQGHLVPVGDDQIPMIEQSNELVRKFNRIYGEEVFPEAKPWLSKTTRLVGIDGKNKASKSLNNAIYLKDSPEEIREKVFAMYTDPQHIKVSDPGRLEGNAVFAYLEAFHKDPQEIKALQEHYKKGGLGDMTLKTLLNDTLQTLLQPIREKRQSITDAQVQHVLEEGREQGLKVTGKTLEKARAAMALNYF